MVGLVQADHVLVLYTCWELTSITSFLLIGNRHTESRARAAALHALLVTGAGGLALLGGLVLLGQEAGTYRLSEILADPPPDSAAVDGRDGARARRRLHEVGAVPVPRLAARRDGGADAGQRLPALGDDGDGRRVPRRPCSRRCSPTADLWRPLVLAVGCCTLVFGGLRALRQHDLKLLLAFGTVSQLGLLMVLFGAGTPAAATAGWVLLVAHAAFKAALFMVVGIIDHQTGTRDIRELPALRDGWRRVEVVTVLAAASMAGVPLGAGFVAKELAYDALGDAAFGGERRRARRRRRRVDAHRRVRASASTGARSSRRAAHASAGRPPRHRRQRRRSSRPPRSSPSSGSCSASRSASPTGSSTASLAGYRAQRRGAPRAVARRSACRSRLSVADARRRCRCSRSATAGCSRVLARGERDPERRRGLPRACCAASASCRRA